MRPTKWDFFLASRMDNEDGSLGQLRSRIHALGERRGRRIWTAGHTENLSGMPPQKVLAHCLQRVSEARNFILILDGTYGAKVMPAELCVLELEVLYALINSKSLLIYRLAPYHTDHRATALARIVEATYPGLMIESEELSADEIAVDIEGRIEGQRPANVPRSVLHTFDDISIRFLGGQFFPLRDSPPEIELIQQLLADAESAETEPLRLLRCWMAIRLLCSAPYVEPAYSSHAGLWEKALSLWASKAAWFGMHGSHPLGRLAAVNSLLDIMSMQGQVSTERAVSTRGALASEYYSLSKVTSGAQRRDLLLRAKAFLDDALKHSTGDLSGLLGIRGSVLQALGSFSAGVDDYRKMLALREGKSPGEIGEAEAELGFGLLKICRILKAGKLLRSGVAHLRQSNRTEFLVRALRKLAVFYLISGRPWVAYRVLWEALSIARSEGAEGQTRQILPWLRVLHWVTPHCVRRRKSDH